VRREHNQQLLDIISIIRIILMLFKHTNMQKIVLNWAYHKCQFKQAWITWNSRTVINARLIDIHTMTHKSN
jgi:hypothetical protein